MTSVRNCVLILFMKIMVKMRVLTFENVNGAAAAGGDVVR